MEINFEQIFFAILVANYIVCVWLLLSQARIPTEHELLEQQTLSMEKDDWDWPKKVSVPLTTRYDNA